MRRRSFHCESCGWEDTRYYDVGEKEPKSVKCKDCGKRADRFYRAMQSRPTKGWPLASDAAGVHPSQISAAREADQRLGVHCDFTPDGRRIFNDRGHRRDWFRAHNAASTDPSTTWIDRDGGYGD